MRYDVEVGDGATTLRRARDTVTGDRVVLECAARSDRLRKIQSTHGVSKNTRACGEVFKADRTDRIKVIVLSFNGFAAAIAALLTTAQTGTADPNVGIGYELDAIAAVIIGGAPLTGGAGTILGSVLGMLLIGMIRNGLVIIGVSIYLLIVVSGLIVIAAVAVNLLVDRSRKAGERR
jgi:ABC-type xylose transport system permease subunit